MRNFNFVYIFFFLLILTNNSINCMKSILPESSYMKRVLPKTRKIMTISSEDSKSSEYTIPENFEEIPLDSSEEIPPHNAPENTNSITFEEIFDLDASLKNSIICKFKKDLKDNIPPLVAIPIITFFFLKSESNFDKNRDLVIQILKKYKNYSKIISNESYSKIVNKSLLIPLINLYLVEYLVKKKRIRKYILVEKCYDEIYDNLDEDETLIFHTITKLSALFYETFITFLDFQKIEFQKKTNKLKTKSQLYECEEKESLKIYISEINNFKISKNKIQTFLLKSQNIFFSIFRHKFPLLGLTKAQQIFISLFDDFIKICILKKKI